MARGNDFAYFMDNFYAKTKFVFCFFMLGIVGTENVSSIKIFLQQCHITYCFDLKQKLISVLKLTEVPANKIFKQIDLRSDTEALNFICHLHVSNNVKHTCT